MNFYEDTKESKAGYQDSVDNNLIVLFPTQNYLKIRNIMCVNYFYGVLCKAFKLSFLCNCMEKSDQYI